jgi:hypothetical protein
VIGMFRTDKVNGQNCTKRRKFITITPVCLRFPFPLTKLFLQNPFYFRVLFIHLYLRRFNLLKINGFFTYHQVWHSKILHAGRFALSVLYGSQNRQRPLL